MKTLITQTENSSIKKAALKNENPLNLNTSKNSNSTTTYIKSSSPFAGKKKGNPKLYIL